MRLIIFMFYFMMFAPVLLMFQTLYNNIFGRVDNTEHSTLSLTIWTYVGVAPNKWETHHLPLDQLENLGRFANKLLNYTAC